MDTHTLAIELNELFFFDLPTHALIVNTVTSLMNR